MGGCSRLGVGGLGCRLETFLTLLRTYAFPFYPFFLFNDYSFFIIYVYMPAFLFSFRPSLMFFLLSVESVVGSRVVGGMRTRFVYAPF